MFTALLLKLFVPGAEKEMTAQRRIRCGILSGITGIVCNTLLVVVKIILAVSAGSIAVAADAVNNLSDAVTGIITAAGFFISGTPPDAEHPFGHGRTEYVAGLVVAVLVMVLGFSFLKDSVLSLFHPEKIKGGRLVVIVFTSTLLVKCWLFFFYRKIASLLSSDVVRGAAFDSLSDCLGSLLVIVSLVASRYTTFPLDGCAGIVIALMILWAGGSVLKDTVNKLLGEQPKSALAEKLRETILACPGIDGVHDLLIHSYGENSHYVTAHAEISGEGDRLSAHDILENAERTVEKVLPVHLLLHGDLCSKSSPEALYWRSRMETVMDEIWGEDAFQLYDLRVGQDENGEVNVLYARILLPGECSASPEEIHDILQKKMREHDEKIVLKIHFSRITSEECNDV